jgi:hypothetical protein
MSEPTIKESVIAGWRNGNRPLLLSVLLTALALGLFMLAFGLYLFGIRLGGERNPVEYIVPFQIIVLPLEDGSAASLEFEPGQTMIVLATRCNNSQSMINVRGESQWRNLATGVTLPNKDIDRRLMPGCHTRVSFHTLPRDIEPGLWRLEATVCRRANPDHCAEWFTDEFEVTR